MRQWIQEGCIELSGVQSNLIVCADFDTGMRTANMDTSVSHGNEAPMGMHL